MKKRYYNEVLYTLAALFIEGIVVVMVDSLIIKSILEVMNLDSVLKEKMRKLLVEATEKQIELMQLDDWKNELLHRAPPVLWFGDLCSTKPRIVTIGANPSREEYLRMGREEAKSAIAKTNNHNMLKYLEVPDNRFKVLGRSKSMNELLTSTSLQDEVIDGYNNYFITGHSYGSWFGTFQGGKVEGFLNGLDASFYDNINKYYTCVHLDLFPFATISDFKTIKSIAKRDLFNTDWASAFLRKIIDYLNPQLIIVFGSENPKQFKAFFRKQSFVERVNGIYKPNRGPEKRQPYDAKYQIYRLNNKYNVVEVSTYLGNPVAWYKEDLNKLGGYIQEQLSKLNRV